MNAMYGKTNILEPFLKDSQDLINNNKWEEIYNLLNSKDRFFKWGLNNITIGWFTKLILNCGINPLLYMDHVPQNFLNSVDLTNSTYLETPGTFVIPDNIKKIDFNSFVGVKGISNFILPENLEEIEDHSLPIGVNLNLHIKSVEKFLKVKFGTDGLNPILYPSENIKVICNDVMVKLTDVKIDSTLASNNNATYYSPWSIKYDDIVTKHYVDINYNNSSSIKTRWDRVKIDNFNDWKEF